MRLLSKDTKAEMMVDVEQISMDTIHVLEYRISPAIYTNTNVHIEAPSEKGKHRGTSNA